MSNPLVSIVLCCHNRADYLALTLDSVLAQTYQPVEIIVMDDGSSDGTAELLASYGDQIRSFRQECQGIAVARTNASQHARGAFIAYQDDDDLMPPDRIESLLAALEAHPEAVLATGDFALIDADGHETGHRWLPAGDRPEGSLRVLDDGHNAILWPLVPAVPHTTLFRKQHGEQVNWFDHDFRHACSDSDFLARLGRLGSIVYLKQVVSYYRRGHSALWSDDLRTSCSRVQLWDKHLKLLQGKNPELAAQLDQRLCDALCRIHFGARCASEEKKLEYRTQHWLDVGLQHLSSRQRLRYEWMTKVRMPVRNRLRGAPIAGARFT